MGLAAPGFTSCRAGRAGVVAATVVNIVSSGSAAKSPRRYVVAIVAAFSLIAAALGYWALRVETMAEAPPPVSAPILHLDAGPAHVGGDAAPASHVHSISDLNDDKAFKGAGLKRDRPPTFTFSVPRASSLLPPAARTAWIGYLSSASARAPAPLYACENLLVQLCVSRR